MVTPIASSDSSAKPATTAAAAQNAKPSVPTQPAVPFAKLMARLAMPREGERAERGLATTLQAAATSGHAHEATAREQRDRMEAGEREDAEHADGESTRETRHRDARSANAEDDALSSWSRHCADLAAPTPSMASMAMAARAEAAQGATATRAHASLEELLPGMVKRVAWSGDGKRGAVRMELGSGELAGGVLLVEADGPNVRVKLEAPAGVSTSSWEQTIRSRLEARGLNVESVDVF